MKLFEWLFGAQPTKRAASVGEAQSEVKPSLEEPEVNDKYYGFDIEFLPLTGRYYPRYNGRYLYCCPQSGRYSLNEDRVYTEYSRTKEGAKTAIDKYLEVRGVNTQFLKVE
jgi:hypothetical protein